MPTTNDDILNAINSQNELITKLSVRQQRMERVLVGDEEFKQMGLCSQMELVSKYIEKDKIDKAKQRGTIIWGSTAGAGGMVGIIEWIKSLFS